MIIYKEKNKHHQTNDKDKKMFKVLDEEKMWQDVAGIDMIKRLGPQSKEEFEYYKNL